MKKVYSWSDIGTFWKVFNNIPDPAALHPERTGMNCAIFRDGIRPLWEESRNVNGGKWVICLPSTDPAAVSCIWRDIVLYTIGETLPGTAPNGVTFIVRFKGFRISVWLPQSPLLQTVAEIRNQGSFLRGIVHEYGFIEPNAKITIEYKEHQSAISTGSAYESTSVICA